MNELVTPAQMRGLESTAFARGVAEEALMEAAGGGLAEVLARRCPDGGTLVVFAGKGHNAGDAFVAARLLGRSAKWRCEMRLVFPVAEMKPLALAKFQQLGEVPTASLDAPMPHGHVVLLDGVLGIGAAGELSGEVLRACKQMNRWRERSFAEVVAVDLPSGLGSELAVVADCTVTFGFPKTVLVEDAATAFVGELVVIPLADLAQPEPGDFVITESWVRSALPRKRHFAMHKAQAGRVGIVAGSRGCLGAARLSATAAVRAGAGLVTLFVPEDLYALAAPACTPEVMVRTFTDIAAASIEVWGIGPGLGPTLLPKIFDWLSALTSPAVLDADALNWISQVGLCALEAPAGPRLLTPHPGEMRRLLLGWRPELADQSRAVQATEFGRAFGVTLLLKGSRTVIAQSGQPLAYNSTGHPSMATGGMGDLLTGVTAALMAQGLQPYAAAGVSSWILGRAGELAAPKGYGATLVLEQLHAARRSALD